MVLIWRSVKGGLGEGGEAEVKKKGKVAMKKGCTRKGEVGYNLEFQGRRKKGGKKAC